MLATRRQCDIDEDAYLVKLNALLSTVEQRWTLLDNFSDVLRRVIKQLTRLSRPAKTRAQSRQKCP